MILQFIENDYLEKGLLEAPIYSLEINDNSWVITSRFCWGYPIDEDQVIGVTNGMCSDT